MAIEILQKGPWMITLVRVKAFGLWEGLWALAVLRGSPSSPELLGFSLWYLDLDSMAAAPASSSSVLTERRGIPAASFVEDVQTYLTQSGLDVNSSLSFLQERFHLSPSFVLVCIDFNLFLLKARCMSRYGSFAFLNENLSSLGLLWFYFYWL